MYELDVLVPTYRRPLSLAVLLTSLVAQTYQGFTLVISDQSEDNEVSEHNTLKTVFRVLALGGNEVRLLKHLPRKGIAEQREFLLSQVQAKYCLFLDDDLLLENYVIAETLSAIKKAGCGFVGRAPIGLSYIYEERPDEQLIEFWEGIPCPEDVRWRSPEWERHKLHNAANIHHVARHLGVRPHDQRMYKIAWVGGCVLYDTAKLKEIDGFSFWKQLPLELCGEEVLVQHRLMRKYGGCGLLPSGVYHQEVETTIPNRNNNAPEIVMIR